ncbi:metal-sulfur cluster assembly factor [Catellatospora bangladeshensis]|uniref:Metal-sulfur cluster biosynthesis protein n=1 Tax=Catellatospora bangladeshensis TaxID=310355 RepID=A0A8J3JEI7_9ACTN|nr:metal-sulfur cluster assembly factor [Catellatospora bangladeshensis]GIF79201.1 metal-sulfur cluster biosynthesis protein [Catellatospora bangladeshensis]
MSETDIAEGAVDTTRTSEQEAALAAEATTDAVATRTVKKAELDDVREAMKDVVDPELGINVVDLGLVYGVHVDDDNVATLDMTLTSAACPLTDVIEEQTRAALCTGPGGGLVNDMRINWVWLPPWGPDKITDDGRDQLRSLGFNV